MKEALIVSGGKIEKDFVARYVNERKDSIKIAVDSGMDFFYKEGIQPDVIIGDFDSVEEKSLNYFKAKKGIVWVQLIPEKDDTDTEAAVRHAIRIGCKKIHLLGATGNRMDHQLGNIQLLGIGLSEGVDIRMVDANNRLRMIKEGISIKKDEQYGTYLSLIPFTPKVSGVTLEGMKYPLTDYCLECFKSLGVSNEIVGDIGKISFSQGVLLVIESKD